MDQPTTTWTVAIDADTSSLQRELQETARLGRQFGTVLTSAFEGVALKGRGLSDVIRTVGLGLSRIALDAAFKPLGQAFGGAFADAIGGAGLAFAKGGVLDRGTPIPFATGGIVAAPTTFPLGQGQGLAGERGPEAIMPLSRGPDGRLGVAASGSDAGPVITFNVATPDAESFRRSESQIAALLARAVGQGQRNL